MTRTTARDRYCPPRRVRLNQRRGLSLLEFLGCLIAIVGGLWLGAIYLGVDVRRAVVTAMAESEVLDKVPPAWRPVDPDEAITRQQLVSTLREELGTLRTEITALRADEQASPPEQKPTDRDTAVSGQQAESGPSAEKTLAFWARINEIVLGEEDLQTDTASALTAANAAKVFALKARVSRFAAKAVQAIPSNNVDPSVLQLGEQLAQWYNDGGALYEKAAAIWEVPTTQRAELTERWSRAEQHQRNRAQLLSDKARSLHSALSQRYEVDFPPFAEPVARPAGATSNATGG